MVDNLIFFQRFHVILSKLVITTLKGIMIIMFEIFYKLNTLILNNFFLRKNVTIEKITLA